MDLKPNKTLLVLLLIILAGSALRLYNLGSASIRADEGGTIYLSERAPLDILKSPQDVQPPLFYFILHFWMEIFGKSEFALRLLPAILSILAIPIVYILGKELFNDKIALFSALIFAVSQANIRFAQTLRMYSLLLIFALLSIYFLHKYLENPSRKNVILYAATAALSVYAHYFAGFLLIAQFAYAMLFYKKHKVTFLPLIGTFALAAAFSAPLAPMFVSQLAIKTGLEQTHYVNDPLLQVSFTSLSQNNIFVRLGLIFYHFSVGFLLVNLKSKLFIAILALAGGTFSVSLLGSIKQLYKIEKTKFVFLLTLLVVPTIILGLVWVAKVIPAQTYTRYLLYLSPLYFMLVGYGIFEALPKIDPEKLSKILVPTFIALIVLFNAITLNYYYTLDNGQEDWNAVGKYLDENYKEGDLILMYSGSYFYNLNYSFGKSTTVYSIPSNTHLNSVNLAQVYESLALIDESNACNFKSILNANAVFLIRPVSGTGDEVQTLLNTCFSQSSFSLKDKFESSYKNQKGEKITDIVVYKFER